jgi:hypothetical protein
MPYDIAQLHSALTQAGVTIPALGRDGGGNLHTYDAQGAALPLPKAADKVIKAFKPSPTQRDTDLATVRASGDPTVQALLRLLGLA